MSWLSNMFKGGNNPANSAMPYFDKIPGMEKDYYDPYISKGRESGDILSGKYGELVNDPTAFMEKLMEGYEPSKGYQMKRDEALRAAGNTAAAGGMRGSDQDIEGASKITDMLMGDDMQQWFQNVTGLFGKGLEGEKGLFDTGFNASSNLAGDLANVYGTQGSLAFQGQREKNQRQSDLFSGLMKALGGGLGMAMPGGASIGGTIASKFI